ncbi:MAG: universal stress protein [Propionibacteriaceae bacterium]
MSEDTFHVLVGVDGSEDSLRAVCYAMKEAQIHNGDIHIVHGVDDAVLAGAWGAVYDPTILDEAGKQAVTEAAAELVRLGFPADRIHGDVMLGNPASVLIRESEQADRVIVGRRAGGGLERLFVGSTSASVAASAACPVVMISHATNPDWTGKFARIGVAVGSDGPICGTGAVTWAFEEAQLRGSSLLVMHVVEPPPGFFGRSKTVPVSDQQKLIAAATEQITAGMVELRQQYPEVSAELAVSFGRAIDTLVAQSKSLDLLIVGAHTGGFPHTFGGIVRGLMTHAQCPVGIIRANKQ